MSDEITWQLENENMGHLLIHYAIPAVIGTMANALYNIVDRIFIGQRVGALAISGSALTFPILLFIQAFGMLIGTGAATGVSTHLGHKANDLVDNILGNVLTLTFIIRTLTTILNMISLDDLLTWPGGNEQTVPYVRNYLYIAISGNLLATLDFNFNTVMHAFGYPGKVMFTMMIGAVLNTILDPIFIFWLDMGIQGAIIATVISMTADAAFVVSHFISKDSIIRFHTKYFRSEGPIIWSIFTIGTSPFSIQLVDNVVVVVINHASEKNGGDLVIGVSGIISSIAMLPVMLIVGIA